MDVKTTSMDVKTATMDYKTATMFAIFEDIFLIVANRLPPTFCPRKRIFFVFFTQFVWLQAE